MPLFSKKEVVILKDRTSVDNQIQELKLLEERAYGDLRQNIARQIHFLEKGIHGEDEIMFQLKYSDMDLVILRNLYLVYNDLSAQIDYYIITPKFHFIVECKNLYGNITINSKGDFIRSYNYNGKKIREGIESPIVQNERHMLVLKNLRLQDAGSISKHIINSTYEKFTKPLVVLANTKTILNDKYAPKEIKNKVIRADNLVNTIKQYNNNSKQYPSSRKDLIEQGKYILSFNKENETDYGKQYKLLVEEQERRQQELKSPDEDRICPRCGSTLIKRNGKNGEFFGCAKFPKCRYTENI